MLKKKKLETHIDTNYGITIISDIYHLCSSQIINIEFECLFETKILYKFKGLFILNIPLKFNINILIAQK